MGVAEPAIVAEAETVKTVEFDTVAPEILCTPVGSADEAASVVALAILEEGEADL